MGNIKESIDQLFTGIISQAKMLYLKHDCGDSENMVYMATELKKHFSTYIKDENKKIEAAIILLQDIY